MTTEHQSGGVRGSASANTSDARGYEFVVVSNRLPVDRVIEPDGSASWQHSPGGLVTALEPVAHHERVDEEPGQIIQSTVTTTGDGLLGSSTPPPGASAFVRLQRFAGPEDRGACRRFHPRWGRRATP